MTTLIIGMLLGWLVGFVMGMMTDKKIYKDSCREVAMQMYAKKKRGDK